MKRPVAVITALLLAKAAHAQVNTPAQTTAPAQPTGDATGQAPSATPGTQAGTPPTSAPPPAAQLPVNETAPGQPPANAPALIPPLDPMRPERAATPAPVEAKPAAANTEFRLKAAGPMKIETPDVTLKFGFLLQPQFESVGDPALTGMSNNLFVRRARIIVGATLFKNFEFFLDTDYPDLFKPTKVTAADGTVTYPKATPGMNIQDAFGTAKLIGDALKVDLGYMLPAGAHNALQGATSLYSWDYFTNSFRHSNVFSSTSNPIGRDTGIALRGLLLNDIIEYRIGWFQGKRVNAGTEVNAHNMFRVAGRIQINLLDPETGFFYAGSYLGAKRVLSFGVGYDAQDGYHHSFGDGILDMPLGPGVLTAQADVSHWNGGTWVDLPRQSALMAEAGYLINDIKLSPIGRYEQRWVDRQTAAVPDEARVGGGLAFWPYGHNINLKAFYMRVIPTAPKPAHDYNQVVVQAQFFIF
jgi:hypothetical protein